LAIRENVNEVRLNVVEDALVVGDHQDATFGLLLVGVDALGNNAQCIHVKAGVGLIHDRELWLQQIKLQNLVALLLATGEAFVDGAVGELRVNCQSFLSGADFLNPLAKLRSLAADCGRCGTQEVSNGNARDFSWILHSQEETSACTLINFHLQDVLAVEEDLACGYFVAWVSTKGVSKSGLAGTVRAHDGVDLTGVDGEVDALEDFLRLSGLIGRQDLCVQVTDFKSAHLSQSFRVEANFKLKY